MDGGGIQTPAGGQSRKSKIGRAQIKKPHSMNEAFELNLAIVDMDVRVAVNARLQG